MSIVPLRRASVGMLVAAAAMAAEWTFSASAQLLPGAGSGSGFLLAFDPSNPRPGAEVRVEYRGPAPSDLEHLVLRARYRTPRDRSYDNGLRQTRVAELERGTAGAFRGAFRLPPEVVYAAFALESPDGEWVEDNQGRPWELMVHGEDGRPLLDALEQRFNDQTGRDLRGVLTTARLVTKVHPEAPRAWNLLAMAEAATAGAAGGEEMRARNRARAEGLAEEFRHRPDLTADEVEELARLTAGTPHAAQWRERLQRDHPDHPRVLLDRLSRARAQYRDQPERLLLSCDTLWGETEGRTGTTLLLDQVRGSLASEALTLALRAGSVEEQVQWARRYLEAPLSMVIRGPVTPSLIKAQRLLRASPLREEGIDLATQLLRRWRLDPEEERLLGETVSQQRIRIGGMAASLLTSLGRAYAEAGDTAAAVAAWEEAVRTAPGEGSLRALANAYLDAGDTVPALPLWAQAAAHLDDSSPLADSVRARTGGHFDDEAWAQLVDQARLAGLERRMEGAVAKELPTLELTGPDGLVRSLNEVRAGAEATVVVFVSRFCGFSMQAMPLIQEFAREVAKGEVAVIPVTGDERSEAFLEAFREAGIEIPIHHDHTGEVKLAFNVWGTPSYHLLDRRGVLRFPESGLASLRRQIEALRLEGLN
jgi:tetratricopeptide (TPR) repeat protein